MPLRNRHLFIGDVVALPIALWLAFVTRFEGMPWPAGMWTVFVVVLVLGVPAKLAAMWRVGLYGRLWRYASVRDVTVLVAAVLAAMMVTAVIGVLVVPAVDGGAGRIPLSVLALDTLLTGASVAALRLLARVARLGRSSSLPRRRAVLVGAGAAGSLIVREAAENSYLRILPVAVVDDDPTKHGRSLHGVPVAGSLADLASVVEATRADEVIIAIPSAPGAVVRRVVQAAAAVGVPTRTVPGLHELIDGRRSVSALRKVAIEDLLRRDPVVTDLELVRRLAAARTVMVTGAGGSIGAELCRQIARLEPACLIAVGRGENSVFEIVQELRELAPHVLVEPVIADVRQRERLERVFRQRRPSIVFHAAAHKHVPLMEANVSEAILNNVLGTRTVAELAECHGCERFVLISSDKAVRPSSVMGATKRLAEGVVQEIAARSGRAFMAVRFGNVLGSRGSVIPIFLRQIEAGGPVTITHPDMRRYFMTIPEAVQLVLQAGTMGTGADVFVLDMGEPVRVVDLARDLIRLSGLDADRDIEIRFTGVRPGEKLYEELFFSAENAAPTEHPKILRARNAALELSGPPSVDELLALAHRGVHPDELRRGLRALLADYTGAPAHDAGAAEVPAAEAGDEPATGRLAGV